MLGVDEVDGRHEKPHIGHANSDKTRIAAAFIVSGDRLISRIGQYRTLAGNNCISNVDHVTVRHPSSDLRDTQHAS